ncbi:MAG TPA: SRPBCC family protein [Acidimicrobiales bacterium]|nr:SRPBCC family protein [Acidimicrobiales bacterium]
MSGSRTHYVFKSIWQVEAPAPAVTAVLNDLPSYPAWWPEIREVRRLGDVRFEVVARSFLPYDLRFVSEGVRSGDGVIDARLTGDLEGTVRWTISAEGGGCRLVYDQEVDTHKALLNATAPLARPAFRANHALMMRHGQAGLRTFMAGYAMGAST